MSRPTLEELEWAVAHNNLARNLRADDKAIPVIDTGLGSLSDAQLLSYIKENSARASALAAIPTGEAATLLKQAQDNLAAAEQEQKLRKTKATMHDAMSTEELFALAHRRNSQAALDQMDRAAGVRAMGGNDQDVQRYERQYWARVRNAAAPRTGARGFRGDCVEVFHADTTTVSMASVKSTPSGGLAVPATLTRTGVFSYALPGGGVRRELRLPEEVFHRDALASFAGAPVTIGHPTGPGGQRKVTPGSWKADAVGHVGENISRDGAAMRATLYIDDAKALAHVGAGNIELSNGYDADLDARPGTHPEYGPYDAIQRNIRGNHVALCAPGTARAGASARLHLEGGAR